MTIFFLTVKWCCLFSMQVVGTRFFAIVRPNLETPIQSLQDPGLFPGWVIHGDIVLVIILVIYGRFSIPGLIMSVPKVAHGVVFTFHYS